MKVDEDNVRIGHEAPQNLVLDPTAPSAAHVVYGYFGGKVGFPTVPKDLLEAVERPVLLVDEVDRADEEFESFLLEVLSDFQVTIPEMGTIRATHRPYVILTSNRFRDLSDALRRRCLYLWIDYPGLDKELRIVRTKVPGINERLAVQICCFMQEARRLHLAKVPGVAETLDWAQALVSLHRDALDPEVVRETLGCLFKDVDDLTRVKGEALPGLLASAAE